MSNIVYIYILFFNLFLCQNNTCQDLYDNGIKFEDAGLFELMDASISSALQLNSVAGSDIYVAHIGNFVGELFEHLVGI